MLLTIPDLLDTAEVTRFRNALLGAEWEDGQATAGHIARKVKTNRQLPGDSAVGHELGERLLAALPANPRFIAAALPLKVLPPRFNRYEGGGAYGNHIDNAVFSVPGTAHRVRSDLSATVFLSEPDDYDGGELVIEDTYGDHRIKLPAGHMVLYPGSSLHRVTPVTRGMRLASFFWIQSLVRDDARRAVLYQLDNGIREVGAALPDQPVVASLTGVYHNLLRLWGET